MTVNNYRGESPLTDVVQLQLKEKNIVLTVTPGRSGTALLANLMALLPDTVSTHEPEPRLNYYLRQVQANPESAMPLLLNVKLPAIAGRSCRYYVETSHLYCKGFIEPLLLLGLRPRFVFLKRNPREVALSLYKMNVIPGKTFDGLLVL